MLHTRPREKVLLLRGSFLSVMKKHSPVPYKVGKHYIGHSNVLLEVIQDAYLGKGDFAGEDKLLLTYLRLRALYGKNGGNIYTDLYTLAGLLNRSTRTVRTHLNLLLEKGYLRRKSDGGYQFCSMYSLRPRTRHKARIVRISNKFIMTCSLKEFRAMLMEPVIERCFEVEREIKKAKHKKQFTRDKKGRYLDRRGEIVPNKFANPKVSKQVLRNLACVYAAMLCNRSRSTISNHRRLGITKNYTVPAAMPVTLPEGVDIWQAVFDLNCNSKEGMYFRIKDSVYYSGITERKSCFSTVLSRCGSRFTIRHTPQALVEL